jgi:hypothetical protein
MPPAKVGELLHIVPMVRHLAVWKLPKGLS